ncbi:MAG: RagB/SusD family nutrient uptake outer membrane protein [Bacteroides thetaiotaomicron]
MIYIFRLADIVLLHAEAVNALSGPATAIAEPNLQKIRTRIGLQELNASSKRRADPASFERKTLGTGLRRRAIL